MTVIYEHYSLMTHYISREKLINSFVKLPSSTKWSHTREKKRGIFSIKIQFSLYVHLQNECPGPTIEPLKWVQPTEGKWVQLIVSKSEWISALMCARVQHDKLMVTKCFHATDRIDKPLQSKKKTTSNYLPDSKVIWENMRQIRL